MVPVLHQVDTNHEELVHDSIANFDGTKLATCSSDSRIKIFELIGNQSKLLSELNGHEGAVWQLDWSHPEYDNLLASCSYDRKVIIWREINNKWEKIKEYREHDSSVNSVQWAPREYGLMLACASSDGSISILRRTDDDDWESRKIPNAHSVGVNAISWAPPIAAVSTIYKPTNNSNSTTNHNNQIATSTSDYHQTILNKPKLIKRFVSGGCDSLVKIWKYIEESDKWIEERQWDAHTDWVRDVAWAPSIGLPKWYIASCSQDKKVIIWTNNEGPNGHEWESKVLQDFNDIVWHVSWSVIGNILAVSSGENRITLWREDMNGDFREVSDVTM